MKKWFLKCGIPMILAGTVMLGVGFPTHLNDHNAYLVACCIIVVAGVAIWVADVKRRSKY